MSESLYQYARAVGPDPLPDAAERDRATAKRWSPTEAKKRRLARAAAADQVKSTDTNALAQTVFDIWSETQPQPEPPYLEDDLDPEPTCDSAADPLDDWEGIEL